MTRDERAILEVTDILALRVECAACGSAAVVRPADWKDSPGRCPNCDVWWETPQVDNDYSPLQHLGAGLKALIAQSKAVGVKSLPYKVKLEIQAVR